MSTFTKPVRNRIQLVRITAKYTKNDLAHLMDLPVLTISRWENGSRIPNVYHAIGLSVAFNRLVDEIFADYRNEWIEKINRRVRELENLKVEKNRTETINDNEKRYGKNKR